MKRSAKFRRSASERMKKYWAEHKDEMRTSMRMHWHLKKNKPAKTESGSFSALPTCASNEKIVYCPYCSSKFGMYSSK